jgi:adenosylmethionine-8-amino-7-oxononanoate aminotransferase
MAPKQRLQRGKGPTRAAQLARLDHQYVWHPFTQMRDWLRKPPIVIAQGKGAVLWDVHGREYLDANSSIWTNLHGHNHPVLNRAIRTQLSRIGHSSALGLANEPASLLARDLIALANRPVPNPGDFGSRCSPTRSPRSHSPRRLAKVFFSDNGSTAMEVALKLAYEYARRAGRSRHPRFLSLDGAYHGDTVGAVALGHIDLFHKSYSGLLFKTDKVMAPYCYRCPFNRARAERADARDYRKCHWECLDVLEQKVCRQRKKGNPYAAFVFEPLIQGAAGMIAQPTGWLQRATGLARTQGALLVADEVMTGLCRTGSDWFLASHQEHVRPDFVALAKGLAGGYMPLAATLTTQAVFDAFLGDYAEFKTFFHGHSFTGNPLGAAAAIANLKLLQERSGLRSCQRLESQLRDALRSLWQLPQIGDIRQVGVIAGIELVKNWRTREPFTLSERAGIRVCDAMARKGVLTRPIGNVVVLMPPYCTTQQQLNRMVESLRESVREVLDGAKSI